VSKEQDDTAVAVGGLCESRSKGHDGSRGQILVDLIEDMMVHVRTLLVPSNHDGSHGGYNSPNQHHDDVLSSS
ncbi:hypothetical protein G9A89_000359, partial [Geosiphon pyriformis]